MINNNIYKDKIILIIKMTENTEVGQVKFFDPKRGIGFIDVIKPGTDWYEKSVFFHFSEIKCESSFKKLFPGEIVTFYVGKKDDDPTKYVCKNIRPLYNSKLFVDNDEYVYNCRKRHHKNNEDYNHHSNHSDKTEVTEQESDD
jgi:cold shock CspA family protein